MISVLTPQSVLRSLILLLSPNVSERLPLTLWKKLQYQNILTLTWQNPNPSSNSHRKYSVSKTKILGHPVVENFKQLHYFLEFWIHKCNMQYSRNNGYGRKLSFAIEFSCIVFWKLLLSNCSVLYQKCKHVQVILSQLQGVHNEIFRLIK